MSGLSADRVVVPVDFSEFSFGAVDQAIQIVGEKGSVDVVHVLAPLSAMEYGNLYGTLNDQDRIEHVQKSLTEKLSKVKHAIQIHVEIGDAGREIAEFAKRAKAELIVMPSHGYGFFKHMMLGSVAERVVRLAHCPVLVLRK